jgi:hypothetical protein
MTVLLDPWLECRCEVFRNFQQFLYYAIFWINKAPFNKTKKHQWQPQTRWPLPGCDLQLGYWMKYSSQTHYTVTQRETNSVRATCPLSIIDHIASCSVYLEPPNATGCIKKICLWALPHTWLMMFLIDELASKFLPYVVTCNTIYYSLHLGQILLMVSDNATYNFIYEKHEVC